MSIPIFVVSSLTLENWDYKTPWTTGIGGSETSHIEMCERLAKKYTVTSYSPVANVSTYKNILWDSSYYDGSSSLSWAEKGIYIIYRDPTRFDYKYPKNQVKSEWWFIAQDVDYDGQWTEERLSKVDRYICLCKDHAAFTARKYPQLKDKIYISSNGIRSDYIRKLRPVKKNPNKLFFPSSPDRGLKLLLENWFRIREINPKAELHVAYGFNNMEAIVKICGENDWRYQYQKELLELSKQDGVFFLGRLNQKEVYKHWQNTNIWAHPTDFPETSCITCMDAQALGAWPVTNKFWALKDNVKYGWMVDGIPQKSDLVRSNWLHSLEQAFDYDNEKERKEMQKWALENHDWNNVVKQWSKWIDEDICKLKKS